MTEAQRAREQYDEFLVYSLTLDPWRKLSKGFHDFYLGVQFSETQEKDWKEVGLPLLAINEIRPDIDHQASLLTERTPRFRSLPVSFGDEAVAKIWDDLLLWRWAENDGSLVSHEVIRHMLIYGVGYWKVWIDENGNFGKPHVMLDFVHPHDVYPDPASRKMNFSDCRKLFQRAHFSEEEVQERWPDIDVESLPVSLGADYVESSLRGTDLVKTRGEYDNSSLGTAREYEIIEGYSYAEMPYVSLWDENDVIRGTVPADQLQGRAGEIERARLHTVEYNQRQVHMLVTCGDVVLDEGDLPTSVIPIIPAINSHDGVAHGTSEIAFLQDAQKAVNSSTNLILRYLATSTNAPWVVEDGTVDTKEFTNWGGVHGAVLKVSPGAKIVPERHPPPQLPQGLFLFPNMLREHMHRASSQTPLSQGQADGAQQTFRGTLQMEEFGNRRVSRKRRIINSCIRRLGQCFLDLSQSVYTYPDLIRVVGEDGIVKRLEVNSAQSDGTYMNDLTLGNFDVQVVEDSTIGTSVQAREALNLERYKLQLITKRKYIMDSEMTDKEELIKELGEVEQANAAVQSLRNEIRNLRIQMTGLETEVRRAKRAEFLSEQETDAERDLERKKLLLDREREALKLEREKVKLAARNGAQNPA